MSRTVSADEVRVGYETAMGKELGAIFAALTNELTLLSWLFQEVSELYSEKRARHEVMNRAAPFFFWLVQRTWWDEVLLGINRLVAPPRSMGKDNLSIQLLPALITEPALRGNVQSAVDGVIASAAVTKPWRDKYLAHRDLSHALDQAPAPLPPISVAEVGALLEEMARLLNLVEGHYCRSTTWYKNAPITHGVMSLLYVLRDGLRADEQRQKRLEDGEPRLEDWNDDSPAL